MKEETRTSLDASPPPAPRAATIALVDWSHLVEDFLDNIGVSFEAFCEEMSGGWMFGYIEALRAANVRTVLFCVSARVAAPARFTHRATGATICVLPAPKVYRALRRRVLNPYAGTIEEAAGNVHGIRRVLLALLKDLMPYLSTPLAHLAREVRREECSAILCQDYEHGRFDVCLVLGRLLGLPTFATFQGGDAPLGRLEPLLRPFAVRAASGLIIATRSEAKRVRERYGVPRLRIARIFNPLGLANWGAEDRRGARTALGIPAGARVAAWHGRVQIEIKGLDVLLDAWQKVCRARRGRDLRLLIIGTGNDREELRRRIAEMNLRSSVTWLDEYVRDRRIIRQYLAAADVYVLTSRREGFPVAPLEAMAMGLPVAAVDAPGMPDILEGGENSGGILVPRGDTEALTAALGRLLDDEKLSRALGERARARVEKGFAPAAVGGQLRAFLAERGAAFPRH